MAEKPSDVPDSEISAEVGIPKFDSGKLDIDRLTFGSAGAIYLAIRSYQTKKSFNIDDVFPDDGTTTYESGVLAGLRSVRFLGWKRDRGLITIKSYAGDAEVDKLAIKSSKFDNIDEKEFERRLSEIDSYFSDDVSDI